MRYRLSHDTIHNKIFIGYVYNTGGHTMKKTYISKNVIQRMPRYLRTLNQLYREGVTRISSGELGQRMGLTPSQIRQDFSSFGGFGQQGYGYSVVTLCEEIAAILGVFEGNSAILVGVGRIGQSLLEFFNFEHFGYKLLAAFDVRGELIGETFRGVPVLDCSELQDFVKANKVDVAVLTTCCGEAGKVSETLIRSGVRGIWNFTECELRPGDSGVIIENIHFSDSLLALSYYLSEEK